MLEELFAYSLLLDVGFVSYSEYSEYLDGLFLKSSDEDFLLELEWCFSDIQKSIFILDEITQVTIALRVSTEFQQILLAIFRICHYRFLFYIELACSPCYTY
jgi:hypothetical protein